MDGGDGQTDASTDRQKKLSRSSQFCESPEKASNGETKEDIGTRHTRGEKMKIWVPG